MYKENIVNHGFLEPTIIKDDYIFGAKRSAPIDVLQPNGQWDLFLPENEIQIRDFETWNCTAFATLNVLETLLKRKFAGDYNFSERYVGVMAGTDPEKGGNDPQTVIETIRTKSGIIKDFYIPFDKAKTIEEYYSPKPMLQSLINIGLDWLKVFEIKHEYVENKPKYIKKTLRMSPLGVSVYAWVQDDKTGLYVKPEGEKDTHWTTLYGYEENKFWKVFDSYDNVKKQLDWNYNFSFVKRYYVGLKQQVKKTLMQVFLDILRKFIK